MLYQILIAFLALLYSVHALTVPRNAYAGPASQAPDSTARLIRFYCGSRGLCYERDVQSGRACFVPEVAIADVTEVTTDSKTLCILYNNPITSAACSEPDLGLGTIERSASVKGDELSALKATGFTKLLCQGDWP